MHQDTPFCRRFADGTTCEDVACGHREQRHTVVEEAVEAQREDKAAEAAARDLNIVAADGVLWLLCGWALAMVFPAVRCAYPFAWVPACFVLLSHHNLLSHMMASMCRALEIYMLAAPESRPVGEGQMGTDLRRLDPQAEAGVAAPEGRPDGEAADAPRAGQPAALLGGPV
jgi:hypothetical protein